MTVRIFLCVAALIAASLLGASPRAETIDAPGFETAHVALPTGAILGYVAWISDAAGWTGDDDRALDELAHAGAIAVGVDAKVYLANLRAGRDTHRYGDCIDIFQDIEDLSRRVQHLHPTAFYNLPVIAGVGEGGAIAYAALAQARADDVAGAISLNPAATLGVTGPLCRLDAFPIAGAGARSLAGVSVLPGDWLAAFDDAAAPDSRARFEAFARAGAPVVVTTLPGTETRANLVDLVERRLTTATASGVAALPLVPLPASGPSPVAVIFLSGDGGWRDLDKTISERLQAMGAPVLGWDSLRYFWRLKTPQQTAADLATAMAAYGAKWRADRFALVGYSFGADVLPVVYNLLPPRYRDKVAMISLLGLEPRADFEIHIAGWLGAPPSAAATPLAPELAKISPGLIQCFYGEEETDSACRALADKGAELIETTGGHHFGKDYDALAKDILDGLRRRAAL